MKFADMNLPLPLQKNIAAKGYEEATPVQEAVIAPELGDADLLVSSQTGSGKTVAFGLALSSLLLKGQDRVGRAQKPLVLVVAPTRELALQVARELSWLYHGTGVQVATCVGGMDMRGEMRTLKNGAHIVVGTPGRICDHLERSSLVVDELGAAVLDEADEMLDMGFREELERILQTAPTERRTLLFSATIPKAIEAIARKFTRDAKRLSATSMAEPHQDIQYAGHLIAPREREHAVVNVLRFYDVASALVFCATREGVNHLHASLVERGFAAVAISGELSQAERNRALTAMRDGRARVMVATDVAARGIDLPSVGLVIHADLPHDGAVLQHRSGRTGRAGRKGIAVVLAPIPGRRQAERMVHTAKISLQWTPAPLPEQIQALDAERLVNELSVMIEEGAADAPNNAAIKNLTSRFSAEALAGALVRLESRRLPAAEELPLTQNWRERPKQPPARFGKPSERAERPPQRGGRPQERGGRFQERGERPPERGGRGQERGERPQERGARPQEREGFERQPASGGTIEGPRMRREGPPRFGKPRQEGEHRPAQDGSAPPRRGIREDGVWFRLNLGRERNADPRWLLPMLCRRGNVTKSSIGQIEILARETRFQVVAQAAKSFEASVQKPDKKDPGLRIERLEGGE